MDGSASLSSKCLNCVVAQRGGVCSRGRVAAGQVGSVAVIRGRCLPSNRSAVLVLARSIASRPFFEVLNHRFKVERTLGACWDRIRSSSASIREAAV